MTADDALTARVAALEVGVSSVGRDVGRVESAADRLETSLLAVQITQATMQAAVQTTQATVQAVQETVSKLPTRQRIWPAVLGVAAVMVPMYALVIDLIVNH